MHYTGFDSDGDGNAAVHLDRQDVMCPKGHYNAILQTRSEQPAYTNPLYLHMVQDSAIIIVFSTIYIELFIFIFNLLKKCYNLRLFSFVIFFGFFII